LTGSNVLASKFSKLLLTLGRFVFLLQFKQHFEVI